MSLKVICDLDVVSPYSQLLYMVKIRQQHSFEATLMVRTKRELLNVQENRDVQEIIQSNGPKSEFQKHLWLKYLYIFRNAMGKSGNGNVLQRLMEKVL